MFKRVFDNYPSKPAVIISPLIILVVLGYYYYSRYEDCSHHTYLRLQMYSILKDNSSISFSSLPVYDWDEVLIKVAYKPNDKAKSPDCPFGWDWGDDYRASLIKDENLNMIIFVKSGKPVDYIELERNKVDFENINNPYKPGDDRFVISRRQNDSVVLRPEQ